MQNAQPPAIFLMGPTASGKTALAIEMHRRFPVDIISVDSALVYRGRIPLLVGGTMLYFRALTRGLAVLPSADAGVRKAIEDQARESGWPAMHSRLAALDPEIAERIHPNDPQRISRALEVIELTGRRMSELQKEQEQQELAFRVARFIACPQPRAVLHERIELRFRLMLEEGFMDEMKELRLRSGLHRDMPSMRCVGYRQAWRCLEGEIDHDEMCRQAIVATRQLAKRQLTWLRRETGALWYDSTAGSAQDFVFRELESFLENERC